MSDRRRRRVNDEGEDEGTEPGVKPRGERPSECESEEESGDLGDLSESESTADDGTEKEDDETEEGTDTETEGSYTEEATDSETETEEGEYTDEDEEGLDGERQSGDGQEQPEDNKPDDDEDRKNPAYVPRKGAFYEHDSRDGFEDAEDDKGEITEPKKLKKLWQEENKWGHDYYREDMQAPKSREELMALYGYDILSADKAPEAPPVSKRGRGRGRKRDARFSDYLPRMAVIDTTEYGTDAVPSLDEDGMISYRDSKPVKSSRGRGSTFGRGGNNNNSKFRGRDSTDGYSGGSRDDRYHNKPNQREVTSNNSPGSQDARNYDFPSLGETQGAKPNRGYNQDRGTDYPQQYGNQSSRESNDQSNNYNHDRNNRRSAGSGRFNSSYDEDSNPSYHRRDRNDGNSNYQPKGDGRNYGSGRRFGDADGSNAHQNYRDGGSYNSRNERRDNNDGGHDSNRQMETNWRRSETSGGDNNRRVYQEQRSTGSRGRGRTGYDNGPPRHQQQHQQIDSREYMSSKSSVGTADNQTVPSSAQGSGAPNDSSNVVISNKENVQTINVTITSTTTEKKSYAKERRAKGATTIPKAGGEVQQGPPAVVMGPGPSTVKLADVPAKQYPPHPGSVVSSNPPVVPSGAGPKRYSSQRQQQAVVTPKNPAAMPVDQGASTLYNPALPPPTLFQHDSPSTGGNTAPPPQGPPPTSGQDPQLGFNPSILPPGNPALSFGLPVPTPGIPIPAPTGSPNIFQGPPVSIGGPPAATGPPLMGPPFIAPGMMYGTSPTPNPRVPPPATPVGFPIPMAAYPTGPPPPPNQPPSNVVPPVSQGATNSVPGSQQLPTKPKKVYRGDITYYAPELQQPARTTQKRPKSAIPIVDPQEISQMKAMEKVEEQQREQSDKLSRPSQHPQSPPEGSHATTTGVVLSTKEEQISASPSAKIHPKEEATVPDQGGLQQINSSNSSNSGRSEGTNSDSVNKSVPVSPPGTDSASKAQPILHKDLVTLDSKGEKQVDPAVVSSMENLSLNKQDHPSPVVERAGDAGRFIKGKPSTDITVVDSGSAVKLESSDSLQSPHVVKDDNSRDESVPEPVVVQGEVTS